MYDGQIDLMLICKDLVAGEIKLGYVLKINTIIVAKFQIWSLNLFGVEGVHFSFDFDTNVI